MRSMDKGLVEASVALHSGQPYPHQTSVIVSRALRKDQSSESSQTSCPRLGEILSCSRLS